MGKRSDFVKKPRDAYFTPEKAFTPIIEDLIEQYDGGVIFCEPCAGNAALIKHVEKWVPGSVCIFAMDLEPQAEGILKGDSSTLSGENLENCDLIITNPPFSWNVLQPMLDRWIKLLPTVLLLPADFMHNLRFQKYLTHCYKIVGIGRVKWIEDSKMSGMDNYCWYFFTPEETGNTIFKGRK